MGICRPPIVPGEQTGQPEGPGRGESLRVLLDYTYNSHTLIANAVVGEVIASEEGRQAIREISDAYQISADDAIALVGATGREGEESPPISRVLWDELEHAKLQYGDAMEAAGITLVRRTKDISARITDYAAFTAALQELPDGIAHQDVSMPDETVEIPLSVGVGALLHREAVTTSTILVTQNNEACLAICGGEAPPQARRPYQGISEGSVINPDQRRQADLFPEYAAPIATELERAGVDQWPVAAMRQLAAANDEGLTLEWAVAHSMHLIGDHGTEIGIQRMDTPEAWDAAFRFLDHMEANEPDSALLRGIRKQVTTDIEAALARSAPPETVWPASVRALPTFQETEEQINRLPLQDQRRSARPMLEAALLRFRGS